MGVYKYGVTPSSIKAERVDQRNEMFFKALTGVRKMSSYARPAPKEWEKYKIVKWKKEALEKEEFRKDAAEYYRTLGSEIRYDTKENFLEDLKREQIAVYFE